jgi:hypothetical protein
VVKNSCYRKKFKQLIPYHFHNRALIAGVEEIQGMVMLLIATYVYETQKKTALYTSFKIELD